MFEGRYSREALWEREVQSRDPVPDDVFDQQAAAKYGLLAHEATVPSVVRRIVFECTSAPIEKVRIDDKFPTSTLSECDCSDIVDDLESTFSSSLPRLELDEPALDDVIKWVLDSMRHDQRLGRPA
jgi:hypothetical protein